MPVSYHPLHLHLQKGDWDQCRAELTGTASSFRLRTFRELIRWVHFIWCSLTWFDNVYMFPVNTVRNRNDSLWKDLKDLLFRVEKFTSSW